MKLPSLTLEYERELWNSGYDLVVGVDEVGRGALAGPVTVCAIAFLPVETLSIPEDIFINDSKQLTQKRREKSEQWIKENAYKYSISSSSPQSVDKDGIILSTKKAMQKALQSLFQNCKKGAKSLVVIDGARAPEFITATKRKYEYEAVKRGDSKIFCVAAASIAAKVHRDKIMGKLSIDYPVYGWERNKGYGTLEHRNAIIKYGTTKHHRKSFLSKYQ